MTKQIYEKHTRDYPILFTSVVFEEFFSERMTKLFNYSASPMYLQIKDGILYHYISNTDKWGRIINWLKNNDLDDLLALNKITDKKFLEYKELIKGDYKKDKLDTVVKINNYMKDFTDIIVLVVDLLLYDKTPGKFKDTAFNIRRKYEDIHREQMEIQKDLLLDIEKDLNLESRGILKNLLSSEFKDFQKNKYIPEGLLARNNFFFVEYNKNKKEIYNKEKANKKLKEIVPGYNIKNHDLRGQLAFKGKATGKARIVNLIEEAKHLKEGEILVTSMTDPRYLPAMKRAAGFITDEGGVACHAAIVAREMKKPCIIGTKFATQVLKNGDLVELDAVKNKIKIIK